VIAVLAREVPARSGQEGLAGLDVAEHHNIAMGVHQADAHQLREQTFVVADGWCLVPAFVKLPDRALTSFSTPGAYGGEPVYARSRTHWRAMSTVRRCDSSWLSRVHASADAEASRARWVP